MIMKLNLTRPLVFFDLETTGTSITRDRIVEISYIKVFPDGTTEEKCRRINPEMHIPEASTAIHHITGNDVERLADFSRAGRGVDLASRVVLNDKDEPVFNFGKHKGRPVKEVFRTERSFYSWIMQGDFPKNTKDVLTVLYYEVYPPKKNAN